MIKTRIAAFFSVSLLLLSAAVPPPASAGLQKADELFSRSLYQEALLLYEKNSGLPGVDGLKALYRAAECESLLFRHGEAARRLSLVRLPEDPLWRGRFLLLRAELGRRFLARYEYSLPDEIQPGTTDFAKLTGEEWRRRIENDYDALWELKDVLAAADITHETYFLDLEKASLEYYPSLWDLAALRWGTCLLDGARVPRPFTGGGKKGAQPAEPEIIPAAEKFVAENYKGDYARAAPAAEKAAAIYEDAASRAYGRGPASERWRLQRLLIPFRHAGRVRSADETKLRGAAITILKKWSDSMSSPVARAEAAYEAASLLNAERRYEEAVGFCKKAERLSPGSAPASHCVRLRTGIELPRLEISARPAPPPGKKILDVKVRNVPVVYFRAYKTEPLKLAAAAGGPETGWHALRYPGPGTVEKFLSAKADLEWRTEVAYPGPYEYADLQVDSPELKKGLYLVAASADPGFQPGSSLLSAAPVNITDIFLLGSSGVLGDPEAFLYDPALPERRTDAGIFHLYAVDALSGLPVKDGAIDAFYGRSNGAEPRKVSLRSGADGYAAFSAPLKVSYPGSEWFSLDPLLSRGGAYAYFNGALNAGFAAPEPLELFPETDRPVYRPGQEVRFKVTALIREPRGYRVYDGKSGVKVAARDRNGQEIFSGNFPFTGAGSAAGAFKLPAGRLLGAYALTAELRDNGLVFNSQCPFGVEEYKRPEFEITLGGAASAFRYGAEARVQGTVKYYFGAPVQGAAVKYRVIRSPYIPWYARWRGWFYGGNAASETASGEVRTDDKGGFSFSFVPAPESEDQAAYPSVFRVEAEARDAGGRTITDSRSYNAGAQAYLFDISPEAGFFTSDRPAGFKVRLMDLNEAQAEGAGSYRVCRIDVNPEITAKGSGDGTFGAAPALERIFSEAPDGETVAGAKIKFLKNSPAEIELKPLKAGVYRLRVKAEDPWGGEAETWIVFICADPVPGKSGLALPPIALFERASYQPGETARALIGASALKGVKYVETLAGNFLLARNTLAEGGVSLAEIKVGAEHRGGFGLRWFGAGDFKVYSAAAQAGVPFKDRELSLSLVHDKVLAPGQKVSWALKAKDARGRPVSGEGTVRIFDRSLEYYGSGSGSWTATLYRSRESYAEGRSSLFSPYAVSLQVSSGGLEEMFRVLNRPRKNERAPSFRLGSSRGPRGGRYGTKSVMAMEGADASAPMAAMAEFSGGGDRDMLMKAMPSPAPHAAAAGTGASPGGQVRVRKDFSETAYFNPSLKVENGTGRFSFRIPERLTSWKIASYMLTRDAKRGTLSEETVTKQDLMVRLDIPRFFREGDRSVLTAVINNESGSRLSGQAALSISLEGSPAEERFALKVLSKPFTVKAGGTVPVYWEITAPSGSAVYKIRAVVRSGPLSDAQENDLPVLPARPRLIASMTAYLDGKSTKELKLAELAEKDGTRSVESMRLEIQPQLILPVLNALPFLARYPYECTEQVLNRYVPLAVTGSFYDRYPELKKAAAKLPQRGTRTPAWDRNDPARLMALMESPWEEASKGQQSGPSAVDILDPKMVAAAGEEAMNKLKSYQNEDGSFPWFPGGRSDLYMTLYALEGLAEAARYNVPAPEAAARKALNYVLTALPGRLKAEEEGETALLLYAAYVVTSFPEKWPEQKTALARAKVWADLAVRNSGAITALGKAYAAYVYMRLGERTKAESYLARAMDGAREDEVAGVYWTPEKISWLWYNDTLEKHAFILRTLLALRPKDPRIPGLVKWLLFSRKAGEWKSTKAAAAAIYSLLDVMRARGALARGETFKIEWGGVSDSVALGPYDWVSAPLRWSKRAPGAEEASIPPVISKTGPGAAYASLTAVYTTDLTAVGSPSGMLNVSRKYFLRKKEGEDHELKALEAGDSVSAGDQIEVQLTITAGSRFDYVHIMDPRGAGFEGEALTSGWKWDRLSRYEEPRDSLTNFFVDRLPHGEYVLKYRVRPTTPGTYHIGPAAVQSMYSPEFAAHSSGMTLTVK